MCICYEHYERFAYRYEYVYFTYSYLAMVHNANIFFRLDLRSYKFMSSLFSHQMKFLRYLLSSAHFQVNCFDSMMSSGIFSIPFNFPNHWANQDCYYWQMSSFERNRKNREKPESKNKMIWIFFLFRRFIFLLKKVVGVNQFRSTIPVERIEKTLLLRMAGENWNRHWIWRGWDRS